MKALAALCAAALPAGCTVGPDYVRATVDPPPAWRIDHEPATDLANTRWWQQFGDPALNQLIDEALRNNRDLLAAAARVEQFIGQLQATLAQFCPQIGYGVDASRSRSSRVGLPPLAAGADPYSSLCKGALSAQWQVEQFGRVRRQSEAAQAQLYASEHGRRAVVLSLTTSVAASYIALRGLDRKLEIARATAANLGDTQRSFQLRLEGGVVRSKSSRSTRSPIRRRPPSPRSSCRSPREDAVEGEGVKRLATTAGSQLAGLNAPALMQDVLPERLGLPVAVAAFDAPA